MRFLGIDYGSKKVGLALADESGALAFPHDTLANDDRLRARLEELIEAREITDLVFGHSLDFNGEENPIMLEARGFADIFERAGLSVHFEPEFLTTKQAREHTADAHADASAAALILQTFLDKNRKRCHN